MDKESEQKQKKSLLHDLLFAPQITRFHDREEEIEQLTQWLFEKSVNAIFILGVSGIGKTSLVKKVIDLNLHGFDVVVWRKITATYSFDQFILDLLETLELTIENQSKKNLEKLIHFLAKYKCLIVVDDLESLFVKQQCAGKYCDEHREYQEFFSTIAEIIHQSKFILISQEKNTTTTNASIQSLELKGIDCLFILEEQNLEPESCWQTLIEYYEYHPVYLQEIANLIKQLFAGKVSEFLSENCLVLTDGMKLHLEKTYQRLSKVEQEIALTLSESSRPITREEFKQKLQRSPMEIIGSSGFEGINV